MQRIGAAEEDGGDSGRWRQTIPVGTLSRRQLNIYAIYII